MTRFAVVVAALALVAASAAPAADILIRPGAGIGKLRLGMPEAEALRAYAFPYVEREERPFGRERVEVTFGLSGYSAVLHGERGRTRVVEIATLAAAERTPENVGVGTRESQLLATYRKRMTCDDNSQIWQGRRIYNAMRWCYLRVRGAETIFISQWIGPRRGISYELRSWDPRKAHVYKVIVRTTPPPRDG